MVIVLIKWMIKPEKEAIDAFLHHWRTEALVQDRRGLVGEFLSEVDLEKYTTWDVRGGSSRREGKLFVNVGTWANRDEFEEQIGRYFNDDKPIAPFELERRVRTVLKPVCWRVGEASLPVHDSGGVL
jgi:hypothetical protein